MWVLCVKLDQSFINVKAVDYLNQNINTLITAGIIYFPYVWTCY